MHNPIQTQAKELVILGLGKRLEHFGICNIRITAEFGEIEEHFSVPVILTDINWRRNTSILGTVLRDSGR